MDRKRQDSIDKLVDEQVSRLVNDTLNSLSLTDRQSFSSYSSDVASPCDPSKPAYKDQQHCISFTRYTISEQNKENAVGSDVLIADSGEKSVSQSSTNVNNFNLDKSLNSNDCKQLERDMDDTKSAVTLWGSYEALQNAASCTDPNAVDLKVSTSKNKTVSKEESVLNVSVKCACPVDSSVSLQQRPSLSPAYPARHCDTESPTPTIQRISNKYRYVKSKTDSHTNHKPSGGNVKIFSEKKVFTVSSKIGSLQNTNRAPAGGDVVITTRKLNFKKTARPKINSKSDFVPTQPSKKIITRKLEWNATSKIGSLDNVKHKPAGGNVKIHTAKLEWKAKSKVGSKDNIKYKPLGGNVQIFNEKVRLNGIKSKVGSMENAAHVPGGGNVNISNYQVTSKSSAPARTPRTPANNSRGVSRQPSTTLNNTIPPERKKEKKLVRQ